MTEEPHRPELLAMQTDVQHVADIMNQVADLEETLSDDGNSRAIGMRQGRTRVGFESTRTRIDYSSTNQGEQVLSYRYIWMDNDGAWWSREN